MAFKPSWSGRAPDPPELKVKTSERRAFFGGWLIRAGAQGNLEIAKGTLLPQQALNLVGSCRRHRKRRQVQNARRCGAMQPEQDALRSRLSFQALQSQTAQARLRCLESRAQWRP